MNVVKTMNMGTVKCSLLTVEELLLQRDEEQRVCV